MIRLASPAGSRAAQADSADDSGGPLHDRIIEFNDQLLAALGGSWIQPPTLDDGWHEAAELEPLREQAAQLLAGAGGSAGVAVWADPRTSLLLPFWQSLADGAVTALAVRDPREVAASMAAHHGVEPEQSAQLWLRYTAAACRNDVDHLAVSFRDWFEDVDAVAGRVAAHIGAPAPTAKVLDQIRRMIDPGRAQRTADDIPNGPNMALASAVFSALGSLPRPEALALLDAAHADVTAGRGARAAREQPGALSKELEAERSQRQRLDVETRTQALQLDRLQAEIRRSDEDRRQLDAWLHAAARDHRKLMASNRWRVGSAIGDVVERISRRKAPRSAADRLAALFEEHEAWSRQRELPGGPWAAGAAGESGTRMTAAEERAHRQALYEAFMMHIEVPPPPASRAVAVQPVIVARWHADSGTAGLLATGETLGSLAAAGISSASIVDDEAALPAAMDLASAVGLRMSAPPRSSAAATDLAAALDSLSQASDADYLMLLAPGDRVSPHLAAGLAERLDELGLGEDPAAVVVDHDTMSPDMARTDPCFKPGFSPDFLLEHDYVGRGVLLRPSSVSEAGGWRGPSGTVLRDVLLRLFDQGEAIHKVDRVLLHAGAARHAGADDDAAFAEATLQRRGLGDATSIRAAADGVRVAYRPQGAPLVSILIPFKDRPELLKECVGSIRALTEYSPYELVLLDNDSEDPETLAYLEELAADDDVLVVRYPYPFNYSRINNEAARRASGEFLIFLNNDVKVLSADWIEQLVGYAGLDGVGTVGAKLHFSDGRIQHAGVAVGVKGFAAHMLAGEHEPFLPQPFVRHVRNCSAVTGACCAVRKDRFFEVGGFSESFQVTGSDVELGLRLMRHGYRNVINPDAQLFHYERQSRSHIPVNSIDVRLSVRHYQPYLEHGDPYWNRNWSTQSTAMIPRTAPEPDYQDLLKHWESVLDPQQGADPSRRSEILLNRYDASSADLRANEAVMERFRAARAIEVGSATWFVPYFEHVYRGGIYTIMRIADHFSRHAGTLNRIVIYGHEDMRPKKAQQQIRSAFPSLRFELHTLDFGAPESSLPASDIGVCTLWTSAYRLLRYNQCAGKFYLAQDYEPVFEPANALSGLIEQTYRFGFAGIANTPGVGQAYGAYGNDVISFFPGVDQTLFRPDESAQPRDRVRIVFYGRPRNERNGFTLGIQALLRIKERYGDAVEIVSAGADWDEHEHGVAGAVANLGTLATIERVAELYRSSHIGLVFMFSRHPSYQPLEYMASGCATVTNFNEANLWLLRDRDNAMLAMPTISGVVDALSELIEDASLRRQIVKAGLETVSGHSWDDELDAILRFVQTGEQRDA